MQEVPINSQVLKEINFVREKHGYPTYSSDKVGKHLLYYFVEANNKLSLANVWEDDVELRLRNAEYVESHADKPVFKYND